MTAYEERGWRQGSVLPRELAEQLIPTLDDDQVAVVVSQDCDLTHGSLEVEPTFEVVIARNVDEPRADLEHGKNPRRLQVPVGEQWLDCSMQQRHILDREVLLEHSPCADTVIGERERKQLAKWMGLRYYRTAFPTEFNNRLRGKRKRVERAQKACSELSAIFLHLEHSELPPEESYKIVLIGLIAIDDEDSDAGRAMRASGEQGLKQLRQALNACAGVEVVDHALKTHREMSVHDLALVDRWDVDYLSDREEPEGPVAPRQ